MRVCAKCAEDVAHRPAIVGVWQDFCALLIGQQSRVLKASGDQETGNFVTTRTAYVTAALDLLRNATRRASGGIGLD